MKLLLAVCLFFSPVTAWDMYNPYINLGTNPQILMFHKYPEVPNPGDFVMVPVIFSGEHSLYICFYYDEGHYKTIYDAQIWYRIF